jgi:predicted TIM-barrel fold metal-dependent hydrolase
MAFSLIANHDRAITDAVTSLTVHGALYRHPQLRIALIENGSGWVRPALHELEVAYQRMPAAFPEDPVAAFKRNLYVHPFHEDDPIGLVKLLGPTKVLFGSDYPHVEGMSDPLSFIDDLAGLSEDDKRLIMGGNMMDLLGLGASV